jgi:hypothetical protein
MQLTVKTLKGEKFTIEVEESHTIAQVKDIIVSTLQYYLLTVHSTSIEEDWWMTMITVQSVIQVRQRAHDLFQNCIVL